MGNKKGISLLIPTYNRPYFLRRALISVLNQTRLPDEIIISDDNPSSNENFVAIKDLVEKHKGLIRYRKNSERLGVEKNYSKLLEEANYEYVKFLADDDWLHPETLELMEKVLDRYEEVVLVSSQRIPVNEEEELVYGVEATKPLCSEDQILNGKEVIRKSLTDLKNYVGKFSTYMFRKSHLDINPFQFCGLNFRANADWVLWMYLLSKGNLFYFSRPLSFFTVHSGQDQISLSDQISGVKERIELIFNERVHKTFGIQLTSEEKAQAVENLALDLGYLKLKLPKNKTEELIEILLEKYQKDLLKIMKEEYDRSPFSIIVVTYNSSSTIEKLLESLNASIREDDEVIIIDNASHDDTFSIIEEFLRKKELTNYKVVKLNENIGYAAAVNEGVKLSRNDYLAFVNPDTVLPVNWSKVVYENLKKTEVGAVGAISNYAIDLQDVKRFSSFAEVLEEETFCKYVNLVNEHLGNLYGKSSEEKKFLVGFFLATKKEVFEKVGGFDKELFLGMDDLDYSLKLREHGFKLLLPKNLFVYHEGHVSFKNSKGSEKLRELTENVFAEKLIKKYGFGNVPTPEDLWADKGAIYFATFLPADPKYRFMFKFSDGKVDFRHVAKEIVRKPKVGIITVSYFSSEEIYLMARSLSNLSYTNFHWYIIDHSEDEKEIDLLRSATLVLPDHKVTIIGRENLGYAAGVNFGVELALKDDCEYLWILNPDVEVESNTLIELLRTVLFTGVPVVTCKIRDSVERDKLQYDGFRASYKPFLDYPQRIHRVLFLSGANIFLKAEIFKNVKFEESYFLYFEDNDFYEKLLGCGLYPLYTPYVSVYHKNKSGKFLSSPVEIYYFFRNLIFFFKGRDISFIIEKVFEVYKNIFSNKKKLRSLIAAIYDGVFDKLGKSDLSFLSSLPKDRNKKKLLKSYLDLRRVSKVLAMEKGREYLLLNPRDRDVFYKYFRDAIILMER
ncbi:MAG: glycosyltransferase [Desulfurobacteriaceae bacterium]